MDLPGVGIAKHIILPPLPCKKYFFALAKQADAEYFEGDFVVGVYKSIMQGLQEAVAYTEGRCPEAIIHIIPDRNLEERESTPPSLLR